MPRHLDDEEGSKKYTKKKETIARTFEQFLLL